ncbi:unnamed protein product [Adineta steineri]|uniref:G-protein coupled receptors family 1 profile domain-containing protein n=1 Tax=Adineta steineri TaxID=433720 RepID=A0A815N5F6_9BILA|nr:unnamed protein product [Adineta steineri]CAF1287056.1 unnamed protein product [Adineta steineri]CAF1431992.1 unnamed protein product [Adineta steineri]
MKLKIWFNYSSIMNEDLSPDNPLFWSQPTPISCDIVRIVGIFLCIAAVFGILLNGALVYSFIRYKALRRSSNIYVMFIAIIGLIASCTILPLTGISSVYCKWLYKRIGCQMSAALAFIYGCSSSYLLCVVSLSRCYIIIRPLNANTVTVTKSIIISCFAVLLAFIWAMLPIFGWNEYIMEGARTSCCINWYDRRLSYVSFTYFLFVFVYFIPLVILIVSNTITLIGLKRMREKIKHGVNTPLSRKRIEMERRIIKSIIITTCGFIFTWSPYAAALFVSAFQGKDYAIPPLATFLCACFAKSSIIWIPLLHIGTSTQFQFHFVNLTTVNNQVESNKMENEVLQTPLMTHINDGSVIVRTATLLAKKSEF